MKTAKSAETNTQLVLTMGGRGGVGKTIALVSIADYLLAKSHTFFCTDCDTENAGKLTSFSHWFGGKAISLNLRDLSDCEKLLEGSAKSDAPFVLADLPANASGDLAGFWKECATPEALKELKLGVIAVGVVTPARGSALSVWEWIDTLGSNVQYLIALNRLGFQRVPPPQREAFSDWYMIQDKGISLPTFEIPHLYGPAIEAMTSLGKLPSKVIKDGDLSVLSRSRIKRWRDSIHAQLDTLELFHLANAKSEMVIQ